MNNIYFINNIIVNFFWILRVLIKHNLFYFYKASLNNNRLYILTSCKHIFHSQCLEKWMELKKECPNCRASLENLL